VQFFHLKGGQAQGPLNTPLPEMYRLKCFASTLLDGNSDDQDGVLNDIERRQQTRRQLGLRK